MNTQTLETYLVIMRALECGPFKELAAKLKEELEEVVDETRLDFLGHKHRRDLTNLLARYPSLNFSNILLADATREFLHVRSMAEKGPRSYNIHKRLQARRCRGPLPITRTVPSEIYSRIKLHRRIMGHLSQAYCVSFDQTGQYVFTGADDHLIKIWCAKDGRLLKTLRGHDGHICDMSVNYENRLLASAGMDKIIRIWDLKTSKLLECLTAHSATVTSVRFAPYNRHGDDRYLISTSNDGSIVFWVYDVDKFGFKKLRKFQERNRPGGQITCSSFSTGGSFLACGASDNYIHIYGFHPDIGPYWISELHNHQDKVDSVQFSNHGFRFISGSNDGTAIIWSFKNSKWEPLRLNMDTQLDQTIVKRPNNQPARVLIVQWSRDDRFVMTSIDDYSIKVWESLTGKLVYILKEHWHDIYLLESHPIDPRIFISAGHDGLLVIWDVVTGKCIKKIVNKIDPNGPTNHQNIPNFFDIKFSPDGNLLAATDSHGYLTLFGNGSSDLYQQVPEEMFFHTDYRPLIRDVRHFVMDENTHVAPHLMPRPTLVDMNGNPHHIRFQRLVPDNTDGIVIPPLTQTQLECMARVIANHSKQEDEDYMSQKRDLNYYSDSDTIIDSDATEIDEEYLHINCQQSVSYQHNLRSRSYGVVRDRGERRIRRFSARIRRKRSRLS